MSLKEIARQYYEQGNNIVVLNAGKEPLVKWTKWQTQRQTIEEFEALPWDRAEAFALLCGLKLNNGLYVGAIDLDTKKVSEEAVERGRRFEKFLRVTQTEGTPSGGKHFIYYSRSPVKSDGKAHDFCGVEVLGERKLCVMAPSKGYVKLNDNLPTTVENLNELVNDILKRLGFKEIRRIPTNYENSYREPRSLKIRPCILELVNSGKEWSHIERVAIVTEYLNAGVKPRDIELLFRKQPDYDPEKTRYQIEHITKGKYKKFLCSTLENEGICIPSCPQAKVRASLKHEPSEPWTGDLDELMREADKHDILEAYASTIKKDETATLITFLTTLLNYTKDEQQNIIFKSQTSSGKTHIALNVTSLFPEEDVKIFYNVSPRAFWHEHGVWDPETRTIIVDLEKQILVFLDQKSNKLIEEMRAVLSHDQKVLETKITDRNRRQGHATKTVQIIGFPTWIFCSATAFLHPEDTNRAFLLSASTEAEKLKESLKLLAERKGDPLSYEKILRQDEKRKWLRARIKAIKNANIQHVILPEDLRRTLYEKFIEDHPALTPRHQRDFPRLIALVKAWALFNFANRKHLQTPEGTSIEATETDLMNAYALYREISESNELGLPPEIYELWTKVIRPTIQANPEHFATRQEISQTYFKQQRRILPKHQLKDALETLEACGLIFQLPHPQDKRLKVIAETQGPLQTQLQEGEV